VKINRRQFIKLTGLTAASATVIDLGFDFSATAAEVTGFRTKNVTPVPSICPFCSCGCGFLVYSERDASGKFVKLLSVEGDPDNPVNLGGACAKGASLFNIRDIYDPKTKEQMDNPKRVTKPLYRAPGSDKWEEKEWDWMLDRIAERIKESRDKSMKHKEVIKIKQADGSEVDKEVIVNRCEGIASLGGAGLDNEECYLLSKSMRGLGLVYLEHQARI